MQQRKQQWVVPIGGGGVGPEPYLSEALHDRDLGAIEIDRGDIVGDHRVADRIECRRQCRLPHSGVTDKEDSSPPEHYAAGMQDEIATLVENDTKSGTQQKEPDNPVIDVGYRLQFYLPSLPNPASPD